MNKLTTDNFAARLEHANLASKNDIADFDDKLKSLNKKLLQIKQKPEKKITDSTNKVAQISKKGYDFLLGRMYFRSNDGYQNILVFAPMLNSLILDSNKKVTNQISTIISTEKIKPFDTNLEPIMSNLANELNHWPRNPANNFSLKNCFFGTVKLVRNAIKSKFIYKG